VAQVAQAQDYTAFGAAMEGRSFSMAAYRFGFNGKENDTDWGPQLIEDYGFRLYNPALGRFLTVDPLLRQYPSWSPYPFAMNRPIDGVDLDGLEWSKATEQLLPDGTILRNMSLHVKVINHATKPATVDALGNIVDEGNLNILPHTMAFIQGMGSEFSGERISTSGQRIQYILNVSVEFLSADEAEKVRFDEYGNVSDGFYLEFVDAIEQRNNKDIILGKADKVGSPSINRIRIAVYDLEKNNSLITDMIQIMAVSIHEGGHTAGLEHNFPRIPGNVMNSSQIGDQEPEIDISIEQIELIYEGLPTSEDLGNGGINPNASPKSDIPDRPEAPKPSRNK
jgi:RHS repeat-associated protein